MKDKSEQKAWFEAGFFKIGTIIGVFLAINTLLILFVNWLSQMNSERTKFGLAAINVIVLIAFCLSLRKPSHLYFKKDKTGKVENSIRSFWDSLGLLDIKSKDNLVEVGGKKFDGIELAKDNEKRVNKLVDQYTSHIFWFAFLLMILYFIFGIDVFNEFFKGKDDLLYPIFKIVLKIAEDILNFTNSIFIFLGFMVLYDKTLDKDNENLRYKDAVALFSGIIIAIYLVAVAPYFLYSLKEKPDINPDTLLIEINQKTLGSIKNINEDKLSNLIKKVDEIIKNPPKDESSKLKLVNPVCKLI
ncbi:MAG: hypothetical protein WA584_18465 [Pyrinomonadaceae bacterium]